MAAHRVTQGCNPPLNDQVCPESLVTQGAVAAFLSRGPDLDFDL